MAHYMDYQSKSNSGYTYTLAYQPITNVVGIGIYVKDSNKLRLQLRCSNQIETFSQTTRLRKVYAELKNQGEWTKNFSEHNNYISIGLADHHTLTSAFADAVRAILRVNYSYGGTF